MLICAPQSQADEKNGFQLGPGDSIHIAVYRNTDLTLDIRVNADGTINFPLLGIIQVAGHTISDAETLIAKGLKDGGYVQDPQVNITLIVVRANQVSVLGQVNRPGIFPIEISNMHLSEVLSLAGGVTVNGSDKVILMGSRDGKSYRKEIDIASIFIDNKSADDEIISGRDEIYVPLAPVFYIYGEVQRPGSLPLLRGMSVMQALAQGGGLTPRGTERNIQLHRRNAKGEVEKIHPAMTDQIQQNDVIYVRESLF
jgi:polysaccharide export outer membrane protein